jgi:mono/diheme cytochrome c family protein
MNWKSFVLGLVIGLISIPVAAWAYLKLGYAPVATSSPPMPFEKYFAKTALNAKVFRDAPQDNKTPPTEANRLEAAKLYRENCAVCHGLPGQSKTAIAEGMFPKPPQLFQGMGVTDDRTGVTYWKIRNGIRLTGMPGFQGSLTDDQMWKISDLLANADKLSASVQQELKHTDLSVSPDSALTHASRQR